MDAQDTAGTGWRGSRDGWLEAGYRALIEGGVDAVKIMPLARQLNLSRTSFYWFFHDREALLAALLGWLARTDHGAPDRGNAPICRDPGRGDAERPVLFPDTGRL